MRALDRLWWRWLAVLAAAALLAPLGTATVAHAQPSTDLGFDFEDGVDGWFAPDWLDANAGAPFRDTTQVHSGAASLALPVRYPAGVGWAQSGAVYRFPDAPVDLLGYQSVSFHVYAPVAGLSADLVFNDPWNPPTGLRALAQGWNEVTFDLTPASDDWPGGVPSANEFIVRIVAQSLPETYDGPVWIDLIEFVPGTAPGLSMVTPQPDATVSTPPGETYQIQARAGASAGRELESVSWRTPAQQGELVETPDGWVGEWDIWAEGEGVAELAVTATDDAGESSTVRSTVLVRNSGLMLDIETPGFDEQLAGEVEVVATILEDPRFDLTEVVLYGLENDLGEVPMELAPGPAVGTWVATATVDTTALADGIESFAVEARDTQLAVRDLVHVVIRNTPQEWDFVGTEGTSFVHQGEPFAYVGGNEYELFTTPENFGRDQERALDQTVFGEVLHPGTERVWEENIDRQLLEMSRNGITVLRTWAFNRNDEDSAFQRMVDGEIVLQESTFQRLDYIMDSARRHGIRVILTLDNYWGDYGGIGRAAQWLGLDNQLEFFTDPAAIALYQEYAEHLVTRENTVNGMRYAEDPTVFAWELMNEPRTDCAADPTPDRQFCDPTGEVMRGWLRDQASFIKGLASEALVSAGGEAHGWIPTPGGGIQYGGPDEGNHNIPYFDMDVPGIDFFTFHPYPNAAWAGLTKTQTRELVGSLTRMGLARGKPVVMEEWGIVRSEPVYTDDGEVLEPGAPGFEAERRDHYRMMLDACYENGCAGSNVWMLADWADRDLNINLYRPGAAADRDAELVGLLRQWSERFASGAVPEPPTPTCEVRYRATGALAGAFVGELRVTNTGDRPVDGWRLGWWFEGGQELVFPIAATATQEQALVTAENRPWNARIKPGASRTIRFLATTDGENPPPAVFTLNGEVCAVH